MSDVTHVVINRARLAEAIDNHKNPVSVVMTAALLNQAPNKERLQALAGIGIHEWRASESWMYDDFLHLIWALPASEEEAVRSHEEVLSDLNKALRDWRSKDALRWMEQLNGWTITMDPAHPMATVASLNAHDYRTDISMAASGLAWESAEQGGRGIYRFSVYTLANGRAVVWVGGRWRWMNGDCIGDMLQVISALDLNREWSQTAKPTRVERNWSL